MTEAGKKWCKEEIETNWIDVQHVLIKFSEEVEKRAAAKGWGSTDSYNLGIAFKELKRELLGE